MAHTSFVKNNVMTKLLLFLALLPAGLFAARETGSSRLKFATYNPVSNSSIYLEDQKFAAMISNLSNPVNFGFFDQSYKNRLVLGIDRSITSLGPIVSGLTNNVFRAEVDVTVMYNQLVPQGNIFVMNMVSVVKTLTVSFSGFNAHTNGAAPATETDLDAFDFTSGYQTLASISAVRIYNSYASSTPLATSDVPENIYLELLCDAERYYDLNTSAALPYASNGALSLTYLSSISTGNEIEVKWERIPGAEEYDLEWTWLDEYTYGNGGNMPLNTYWNSAPELNFRNNSTRIRTDQNRYRISNVYESGHLLVRLRAVGRSKTPAALTALGNPPMGDSYSNWTWPDIQTVSASAPGGGTGGGLFGLASWPHFIDLRSVAHEQNKNWTFTASFAEEGKKNEVVSYFDGSQHSRQSVTKNNTDSIAVVGETYYDYLGRATIQALPTPVDDARIRFYQQTVNGQTAFNFDDVTGDAFTKAVFALASGPGQCALTLGGWNENYGTAQYYSTNNSFSGLNYNNGYIPQGEKFPFVQTEYTPDNTGKPARQSGAGSALKLENAGGIDKHDTRYLYGSVTQDELDRLFGSEAGHSKRYSKQMVVDPNGQISISYLNHEGKVVATALSGTKPANLQPLLSSGGTTLAAAAALTESDLLNKLSTFAYDTPEDNNQKINSELVYNEKILVSTPQIYYFDYSLQSLTYQDPACGGFFYDCAYDLEFDIRDKCNNRPAGFNGYTYTLGKISGTYPNLTTTNNYDAIGANDIVDFKFQQILAPGNNSLSVSLDVGEYTVTKRLKVNQAALQVYLDHYLKNCISTPADFDNQEAVNLVTDGCEHDCKECLLALGDLPTYIANNPNLSVTDATNEHKALSRACSEPCEHLSYCEAALESMLVDLTPGGQYAEYISSGGAIDADGFPLSIYNAANALPTRNNLSGLTLPPTWRNPVNYANNATGYYDEFGQLDKVPVFQTAPNSGIFNPPILPNSIIGIGTNPNEFYVRPEGLQDAADFIALFKPSWAQSLLIYHPEYAYVEWCLKNSSQKLVTPVTVNYNIYDLTNPNNPIISGTGSSSIWSSDDYDSLYMAVDDIDDIDPASLSVLFNPLSNDPYWSTTGYYYVAPSTTPYLPNPPYSSSLLTNFPNPAENVAATGSIPQLLNASSALPANFNSTTLYGPHRNDKSANNRYYNFQGSGLPLYQYAALIASPLTLQYGQPISSLMTALNAYYSTVPSPSQPESYIMNLVDPNNPGSDALKRQAWENYKTLYLTMKQGLQQEAVQSYVMNGPSRGCNTCIGNGAFEVNSVKYTTYISQLIPPLLFTSLVTGIPSGNLSILTNLVNAINIGMPKEWYMPTYNQDQACGLATKDLYQNKIKRYYMPEDALGLLPNGANNAQANIYAQTGLCPNAYDLLGFMNGMINTSNSINYNNISHSFFNISFNLNQNIPQFSQNLYQAIEPTIPSPFQPAIYSAVILSSQNLSSMIVINGTTCNFNLIMPPNGSLSYLPVNLLGSINDFYNYEWNNATWKINQFVSMQITGVNQFSVGMIVSSTGPNSQSYTIPLSGSISLIPLNGCSFAPPCASNSTGKALNDLLNSFANTAAFPAPYNNGYQTGNLLSAGPPATPYSYLFTNTFKPLLETGAPVNSWQWTYNSGTGEILISDGSPSGNKRLKIAFTQPFSFIPAPGSSNTVPNIDCIQSFQNFQPDPAVPGGFIAEGIISLNNAIGGCNSGTVIVKGVVSLGVFSGSYVYSALNIGTCGFELATCATKEHQAKRDLEAWVTSSQDFASMLTAGASQDISGNPLFTGLLRSYLNSGTTYNNNGPIQNFYHWLPDGPNSNNDQICGWITVTQSQNAPVSAPAGSCYFTIKKITPTGLSVNPASINSMLNTSIGSLFKLTSGPYINNNIYSFKLLTNSFAQDDSMLVTSTHFPLRACDLCTGTTVSSGGASYVIDVVQSNFSTCNGPAVTLTNQDGNTYNILCPVTGPFTLDNANAYVVPTSGVQPINFNLPFNNVTGCPSCAWSQYNPPILSPYTAWGPSLAFVNNASCPTNNCCTYNQNRSTTLDIQNIYFSQGGIFNFQPAFQVSSDNVFCIQPTMLSENIQVFFDNVPIQLPPPNIPSFTPPINGWINPGYVWGGINITPGNHSLKIVFSHRNLNSFVHLLGLTFTKTSNYQVPIPCTNNPWPTDTMPTADYEEPCAPYLQDVVDNTADEKYDAYLADKKDAFIRNYTQYCLNNAIENLRMKYNNTDYHYTLYYYDQAGNLSRTVPPEGVKPLNLGAIYQGAQTNGAAIKEDRASYSVPGYNKKVYTKHNFLTTYTYNSLNQLVRQETPDAGLSKFYYDNLGRLAASQNAEQKYQSTLLASTNQKYSYTRYDALGRIVMVGQLGTSDLDAYPAIPAGQTIRDVLSAVNYPFNLAIAVSSHVDVTHTYYGDDPAFTPIASAAYFSNSMQQNIRGRVASSSVEDVYDGITSTFNHATHYSYDVHGNVKEVVQENPELAHFNYYFTQQNKRTEYDYDLLSGKVHSVTYQRGQPDMFVHNYVYDAANRLTNVYTSRDGITWDQDAKYFYYPHSALARTELGEHKVQSNDHAYTLQGWLKGVNSEALAYDRDMGKDGYDNLNGAPNAYNRNRFNARDAFGYALNYYTNASANAVFDYKPVNGANGSPGTYFLGNLGNSYGINQLFNGNITAMSASYLNPSPTPISLTSLGSAVTVNKYDPYSFMKIYSYDQLNRIISARAAAKAIDANNSWIYTQPGALANEFAEDFKYDQNGNILKAERRLIANNFDNLTYYYYNSSGVAFNPASPPANTIPTNKLAYVDDATMAASVGDIADQAPNNYTYDKIGNLTGDAAENISGISWSVYGKIRGITRNTSARPNLEFRYDAMGNRVSKKVINAVSGITDITYYVRDGQGNIMGTYNVSITGGARILRIAELNIYGSSRLGVKTTNKVIGYFNGGSTVYPGMISAPENHRILGEKSYELSNHLGNVLATISDRKLPVAAVNTQMDYFVPDVLSATDYYAFGAPMPGRQYNNGNYKYGFNGKENDNEIKGTGNSIDFDARIYDSRLGRWLSVDPQTSRGPSQSPYNYCFNSPITHFDPNGEWAEIHTKRYYLGSDGTLIEKQGFRDMFKKTVKIEKNIIIHNAKLYYDAENKKEVTEKEKEALATQIEHGIVSHWKRRSDEKNITAADPTKKKGLSVEVNIVFENGIEVVDNLSSVKSKGKKTDNLFIISDYRVVNEMNKITHGASGIAFGNLIILNTTFLDPGNVAHEFGHTGGLPDGETEYDWLMDNASSPPNDGEKRDLYRGDKDRNRGFNNALRRYERKRLQILKE